MTSFAPVWVRENATKSDRSHTRGMKKFGRPDVVTSKLGLNNDARILVRGSN